MAARCARSISSRAKLGFGNETAHDSIAFGFSCLDLGEGRGGGVEDLPHPPVGDSITEGGKSFSNYRYPLWEKLHAAGYHVEFVGSRTSKSRVGPLRDIDGNILPNPHFTDMKALMDFILLNWIVSSKWRSRTRSIANGPSRARGMIRTTFKSAGWVRSVEPTSLCPSRVRCRRRSNTIFLHVAVVSDGRTVVFSGNMEKLDAFTLKVPCNPEVIAVDQAALG